MRSVRLASAALLAATGLVVVGATTESASAASSKDLTAQYGGKVVKNEKFSLSGKLPMAASRSVWLQYRNKPSGAWTTKTKIKSQVTGAFAFPVSTGKTRYYRYYAPSNSTYTKITGNSRKVTVVKQSVAFFDIANASQCSYIITPVEFADMTAFAKFYPARPGRPVTLQTEKYGTQNGFQDSRGIATFTIDPGTTRQTSKNRVLTAAVGTVPAVYSSYVTTTITTCFLGLP